MIVYDWARQPQEEFRALTSAAIVVLLAITLIANAVAILPPQPVRADMVMRRRMAPDAATGRRADATRGDPS